MKLSKDEYYKVRRFILRKLLIHGIVGAKHTSEENLHKSLPKHLRGFAKDIVSGLIKDGFLLSHPTSHGMQVSLNPNMLQEIKKLVQNAG
jgi:hypothetical protein